MKVYNPYIKKIDRIKSDFAVKSADILYGSIKLSKKNSIKINHRKLDSWEAVFRGKEKIKTIKTLAKNQYIDIEDCILEDLVTIDKINNLKRGLKKILKEFKSSSSYFVNNSDEVEDFFNNIKTDYYWDRWIHVGEIEFPEGHPLSKQIKYIDISLENLTTSIIRISLYIKLKEEYNKEIRKIIESPYHDINEVHINKGVKDSFFDLISVSRINGDIYKNKEIQNSLIYLKWSVLKEFARYIPLYFYNKNLPSPSIEFFKGKEVFGSQNDEVIKYMKKLGIDKSCAGLYGYNIQSKYEVYYENFHTEFNSNSLKFIYDNKKIDSIFQFGFLSSKTEMGRKILKYMSIETMCKSIYNILGDRKENLVKNTIGKSKYKDLFHMRYEIEQSSAILKSLERYMNSSRLETSEYEMNEVLEFKKSNSIISEIFQNSKSILIELDKDIDLNRKLLDDTINLLSIKFNRKSQKRTITLTIITVVLTAITVVLTAITVWLTVKSLK